MGGQHHALAALPPGKTRYPLYRRLGGSQNRSGCLRKVSPPPGFDPRTVQPVVSRYTDWAIRPITGGNRIYNEVVLELRRETIINLGETSLFFRTKDIYFIPHQHHTDFGNHQVSAQSVPKFSYTVREQPDPESECVISGNAYINSLMASGYFISNQFPLTPFNRICS
jgi:hypothetical protein